MTERRCGLLLNAIAFAVAIALFGSNPALAGNLTKDEAKTLPFDKIKQIVLGEVGQLVVDVDRPTDIGVGLAVSHEQFFSLKFYERPQLNDPSGLCTDAEMTVVFDDHGDPIRLETSMTYGVVNGEIESPSATALAGRTSQEGREANCKNSDPKKGYFSAWYRSDLAIRAALAVKEIQYENAKKSDLIRNTTCYMQSACQAPGFYDRFSTGNIDEVDMVDCKTKGRLLPKGDLPDKLCMNLVMNSNYNSQDELFLETSIVRGRSKISTFHYSAMSPLVH